MAAWIQLAAGGGFYTSLKQKQSHINLYFSTDCCTLSPLSVPVVLYRVVSPGTKDQPRAGSLRNTLRLISGCQASQIWRYVEFATGLRTGQHVSKLHIKDLSLSFRQTVQFIDDFVL